MHLPFLKFLATAAAVSALCTAQAAVVTVGSLTRDTSASTITDSLNNRTWLGWDVTKGLTYAQTLTAIGVGGQFEGYSIARNADAQLFTDAMLGANPCSTFGFNLCAPSLAIGANIRALTGDNYYTGSDTFDYAWFLSDNNTGTEVGYIGSQGTSTHQILKYNDWNDIAAADQYSFTGSQSFAPVGWLLYRENTVVNPAPEPGTLALVGLGLFAAARLRRRA